MIGPRMSVDEVAAVADAHPDRRDRPSRTRRQTFDTVNNDDVLGAELVVQHLVAGGYRNIAYAQHGTAGPGRDGGHHASARSGYRAAMEERRPCPPRQRDRCASRPRARCKRSSKQLLQSRNRPEAIFCWTDYFAFEVLSVATRTGPARPGRPRRRRLRQHQLLRSRPELADQHRPVRPGARPAGRAPADRAHQGPRARPSISSSSRDWSSGGVRSARKSARETRLRSL